MALPRLSTIQTWAVFSVITFASAALSADTGSASGGTGLGSVLDNALSVSASSCSSRQQAFDAAYAAIGDYCGVEAVEASQMSKCVQEKIKPCDETAVATRENMLNPDEDNLDDLKSSCGDIDKFNEKCPGAITVTPEDVSRNRKEVRGLRDDLRKERQDARKNDSEKLKQNQDEANKIMDEQQKNDQDWQKQRKELGDKLREVLKGIDADSMKAIQDMQTRLDQIDMEYIKYRNDLRRKISVANDTELAWNTQCRAVANDAASAAEADLNKRMEAEALLVRNFRATSLAGKTRRDLRIKRQRIINKYNETLAKCLRGDAEPGATAKLKLSQVKNDVRDSQAEANDKAARLEKLRQQIATNVNTMAKTLSDERQQAIQSNQQDTALLDQNHTANQQRLQQRQQQMFQNQWRDSLEQQQTQNELNQRLNDLMGDEAIASADTMCRRKMSKERASDLRTKYSKAVQGFFLLKRNCKHVNGVWKLPIIKDCDLGNEDICSILNTPKGTNSSNSGSDSSDGSSPSSSPSPTTPRTKGSSGATGSSNTNQ